MKEIWKELDNDSQKIIEELTENNRPFKKTIEKLQKAKKGINNYSELIDALKEEINK